MAMDTSPEQPAPVRAIAQAIGGWIDRLGAVWVEGQVTQVNRRAGMNTVFLTLRDQLADISITVTCGRVVYDSLATPLVEGAQIVIHAKPSFYPTRGNLSLQAREIRLVGEGELLARLERRRQLLAEEGLFSVEHKRALPFLPASVGLITAHNSAAEKDVVEVARRRWPGVNFRTKYAAMQGINAVRDVIAAVEVLDDTVDVIIVARGGGSVEDLLPFSDEELVRAVFAASTPVVSAIGHEQDTPLLDLVADLRAATPTDAAKRVVPDVADEAQRVAEARQRGRRIMKQWLDREQQALNALRSRPSLTDPTSSLDVRTQELYQHRDRIRRSLSYHLDRSESDLSLQLARVRALSPLATLSRGYAVISGPDGQAVSSVAKLDTGDQLTIRLADGRISATTQGTERVAANAGPRAAQQEGQTAMTGQEEGDDDG